jgi:hypothetical protein
MLIATFLMFVADQVLSYAEGITSKTLLITAGVLIWWFIACI